MFCNEFADHGGCRGNAVQALAQWQHPLASSKARDVLHWMMRPASYRRIRMVIKIRNCQKILYIFCCRRRTRGLVSWKQQKFLLKYLKYHYGCVCNILTWLHKQIWSFEQNTNHKSSPQLCNHHGNVQKNVIPNTLGVTQSIAYCQNCLVHWKTAIIVNWLFV